MLGGHYGRFHMVDESTRLKKRYDVARILISTKSPEMINSGLRIKIDDGLFIIRLIEESHSVGECRIGSDYKSREEAKSKCKSSSSDNDYDDEPHSDQFADVRSENLSEKEVDESNKLQLALINSMSDPLNEMCIRATGNSWNSGMKEVGIEEVPRSGENMIAAGSVFSGNTANLSTEVNISPTNHSQNSSLLSPNQFARPPFFFAGRHQLFPSGPFFIA